MHLLSNSEPIQLNRLLGTLAPGDWLMQDLNAFEIAQKAARGTVRVKDHGWLPMLSQEEGAPKLIMRSGAIGDLLMLTPALSPETTLSCFNYLHPMFDGLEVKLEPYPLPLANLSRYGSIQSLENILESDSTRHPTDIFREALGIEVGGYIPRYVVTDAEKAATEKWVFRQRPNVAIQMRASVANRTYPFPLWLQVITELEKKGWGVILLGKKGQIPPLPSAAQAPFIRNLAVEDLTLRESAAVLAQCDAFCGVDSAFIHLAAALKIPSVSLHGAFPWQIRTGGYPLNTALSGTGDCAPCNWHMHEGREFPPNKPCSQLGQCVVIAKITPDRIVAKIDLLKP